MADIRIPLFPLNVVLFPGASLPLHIFEPRYKLMIQRCVRHNWEFGVILARENGVTAVGCTAKITRKLKDYEDGRMDILTQGRARFRALHLLQEKDYHEAIVEFLDDLPAAAADSTSEPAAGEDEAVLLALFQECHTLIYGQLWTTTGFDSPWPLSFQMAARLPLDLDEKQVLLELRIEIERRRFLTQRLNDLLPRLNQLHRAQRGASGNGHTLN
ncbi:MAG: LON peptidase substrate-binding domain-containing protein [Candidatus Acidiferrales bacterium]